MAVTNRQASQGVWIGSGFTSEDSSAPFLPGQVGMVVVQGEKAYQYVKFDTFSFSYVNGTPVLWKDRVNFIVTADYDDSAVSRNLPAGVCLLSSTAGNYGWIQVGGPHAAVYTKTSEAAAAGDALVYDGADGEVIKVAAGTAPTYLPVAIATATQSTNATAAYIVVPHNCW